MFPKLVLVAGVVGLVAGQVASAYTIAEYPDITKTTLGQEAPQNEIDKILNYRRPAAAPVPTEGPLKPTKKDDKSTLRALIDEGALRNDAWDALVGDKLPRTTRGQEAPQNEINKILNYRRPAAAPVKPTKKDGKSILRALIDEGALRNDAWDALVGDEPVEIRAYGRDSPDWMRMVQVSHRRHNIETAGIRVTTQVDAKLA